MADGTSRWRLWGCTAVAAALGIESHTVTTLEQLFDGLWRNSDDSHRTLARGVLEGRFTWLEEGIIDPSIPGPWVAETVPGVSKLENVHRHIG